MITVRHRENSNHNGGQLQFGPDGDLYISTGDGGAGGDPPENAQNKNVLLGKILRIDPRKPAGRRSKRYTIPRSNPFVGKDGADEIYSYGLRNPFRFSFDGKRPRDRRRRPGHARGGRLPAGQGRQRRQLRLGRLRGRRHFDDPDASPPVRGTVKPIFDYTHSHGCSITGGYVSHDPRITSLRGRYLFADFCEGDIRSLVPTGKRAQGALDRAAEPVRPLQLRHRHPQQDLVHEPEQRQGLGPQAEEVARRQVLAGQPVSL